MIDRHEEYIRSVNVGGLLPGPDIVLNAHTIQANLTSGVGARVVRMSFMTTITSSTVSMLIK